MRNGYSLVIRRCIELLGFDAKKMYSTLRGARGYITSRKQYKLKLEESSIKHRSFESVSSLSITREYPIIHDIREEAGVTGGHYFHQDLYVANLIYKAKPKIHLDIGSRIDGFIAHLLSFEQKVVLGDIRKATIGSENCSFCYIDLQSDMPIHEEQKYQSISCLHVIEHVGLGRYGDKIDPEGHIKSIYRLSSMLTVDGTLYLSHPTSMIGSVCFNAHRLIPLREAYQVFCEAGLDVKSLLIIDDIGNPGITLKPSDIDYTYNFNLSNGLAVWILKRQKGKIDSCSKT